MTKPAALTDRQQREIDYHARRAEEKAALVEQPPDFEIVTSTGRRPWNAYWAFWTQVRSESWAGRRVLVPGAGYGEDAMRMAKLGALVTASDLSPESVGIAVERARRAGLAITFDVAPLESLPYPDASFDAVLLVDIMHHADVSKALEEIRRVLKPGARILVNEIYTHDVVERGVRKSALVDKLLYPLLRKRVYGGETPYITEDERKLSVAELRAIEAAMRVDGRWWFNAAVGRLFSTDAHWRVAVLDQMALRILGPLARFVAGRVLLSGRR